jgi:hypothetical protein
MNIAWHSSMLEHQESSIVTDACTDLDVQQLIEAGRPWDAVAAGRMLPRLARLHGYGFEVDVAKVRAANLGVEAANLGGGFLFGVDLFGGTPRFGGGAPPPPPPSLLLGTAKKALDTCISGEGEPPLELTIAAVACAGSGVICGIPVEQMREGAMTELDLCKKGLRGAAVMLVAYLIPAMAALTSLDLRFNDIGAEGAKAIADALSSGRAGLTSLNLEDNNIGAEGAKTIANALQSGKAVLSSLNLADNALCGIDAYGQGTYDASGIQALASALAVNAVLTALDLSNNKLTNGRYVKQSKLSVHNKVGDMVKHEGLELQILYKDKESGGDVLLGTLAAIEAIAEALKVNTVLTICNLLKNDLDIKSATMLAEIGKEKRIMLSGIKHDQTEAKFGGYTLQPAEGILIASDLRVSLVLSSLSLHLNGISNEGAKAIAEALSSSGRAVQTNLNLAGNPLGPSSGIGPEGARAIAEALRFKALLKELECARFSGTSNANRAARASPHTIACTLAFLATSRNPLTHTRDSNALRSLKYDHLNDEKKGELRAVAKAILTIEM